MLEGRWKRRAVDEDGEAVVLPATQISCCGFTHQAEGAGVAFGRQLGCRVWTMGVGTGGEQVLGDGGCEDRGDMGVSVCVYVSV